MEKVRETLHGNSETILVGEKGALKMGRVCCLRVFEFRELETESLVRKHNNGP